MDQQQQQSTVTAGDNSKAMWEYEAPQYCDFSSADTFVDTDPTVDKFFLTDHDSTKENDESMAASADGSSDADIFATPLTTRSGQKKSLGTSSSCYRTPKSSSAAAFDSEAATPVAPPVFLTGRLSTLRQTPLREIYNQGGKPLHEAGRRVSVFGKKSAKKAAAAANNKDNKDNHKDNHNNSRRETFDMGNVAEAIEEVSASVAASKEEEEKSSDKENHNGPPAAADELMSEEEEEEEEGEAAKKSEETVVEAFHSVDAEKELSEEAAAASAAPSMADDSSALNSSRRSSYIVKSPSIRVVHFADESVRNSGGLEALVENSNEPQQMTTPVAHNEGGSKSSLKIKARQLTPMVVKEKAEVGKKVAGIVSKTATTTTKASTGNSKNPLSIQGLLRNRLSKKYIKRFSKSMEEEKAKEEEEAKKKKDEEKGHGPSSSAPAAPAAPAAKPKSTVIGLTKKRVTIAAVPAKSATTTTTFARTSTTSGKRGLSLKGSTSTSAGRRFTTAASMLLRKKSLTSAAAGAKTPLKSGANANNNNKGDAPATTGPSRPSPYLGLSVLNAHFMSKYCRNYTPPTAAASSALKKQRPKATVPVSPNLHTSTRCTMRKAHTMPNLAPAAPKPAPVIRKPLPTKPAPTTTAPAAAFVPTKAITPKFSTEARLKLWHVKHGDQADGGAAAPGGGKNGGGLLFKARPMPNFKRMQAAAAKQAAAAIEKGKHAVKPIHQEKK